MTIHIIGAGLSGLIAANLLSDIGEKIIVWESQKGLPNNHSAVLRFRSPIVGEAVGIPFKEVFVHKEVFNKPYATVKDRLDYSYKCRGDKVL